MFGKRECFGFLKKMQGSRIDYLAVWNASTKGKMIDILKTIHVDYWKCMSDIGNDGVGCSLLHYAAMGNNYDAIKLLVENGVDIEMETAYKETAFMIAVKNLELQSTIALIECGANIQTKDYQGKGAFDVLIEKYPNNPDLVLACASVLFHSGLRIDPAYLNVVPIELARLQCFITK